MASRSRINMNETHTIIIEKRVTKDSYEKITNSTKSWPQWKKNICNNELIISVRSKKI
ncbi:hypothetical protein [Ruminococcus difficilis]|uniref:Uncharacterized protein n=1 Tax=Ruminococcus difficilis TaxID=2763069 RepID=A0A934TZI9_9FIRM|nr:hypothetical protein [Ruminococcus difficilis]MBK6087625.1 hypothetical protein [Ruminococcus difficilis]